MYKLEIEPRSFVYGPLCAFKVHGLIILHFLCQYTFYTPSNWYGCATILQMGLWHDKVYIANILPHMLYAEDDTVMALDKNCHVVQDHLQQYINYFISLIGAWKIITTNHKHSRLLIRAHHHHDSTLMALFLLFINNSVFAYPSFT